MEGHAFRWRVRYVLGAGGGMSGWVARRKTQYKSLFHLSLFAVRGTVARSPTYWYKLGEYIESIFSLTRHGANIEYSTLSSEG